jgi:hypothetical protein
VATGAGAVFLSVGFLLATNYRGGRRRILGMAEASLDEVPQLSNALTRLNIRLFHGGDPKSFEHHRTQVMPLILGGVFMVVGGLALLIGLIGLVVRLAHAL